ncbi:TetR/AcrR family transcriptional regulator [Gracilibacillus salinarum]|uniref:TetR/AcrR family transcriptional regulator n=1 Tax=Gracilibacillus salinarum TaxID=2932255 RepID=A0ABY4GQ24_9BACI|nr:TetR-like C-terminal domain-containing protein [Gracilibacillus salinarum]UOQ86455.1 TetR/AcrR family transcriptional regulator [Gracilibacillus salinarum]
MTEKLDRRKKYTRMVLKDSLINLLQYKPISSVTVKEICEKADINRSTFYTHYQDQTDLLTQIEEEFMEDLHRYLDAFSVESEDDALKTLEKLLEYIKDRKNMCQTLLNKHSDTKFENRIIIIARQFVMDHKINMRSEEAAYLSSFLISGAMQVIKDWLTNNTQQTPKQIAEMIDMFIHKGVNAKIH